MTEVIEKRLESLSYYQILAFYVLVIKRQIPNYYSFFQKENWGNPEILELGIRLLENIALERSVLEYDESLIDDISNITPDSEEFDSILATSAQDVCVMLIEALESVSSQDTERLTGLTSLAFNSIQMYIEEKHSLDYNQKNHDEFVNNHPLIKQQTVYFEKLVHDIEVEKNVHPELFQNVEAFHLPTDL